MTQNSFDDSRRPSTVHRFEKASDEEKSIDGSSTDYLVKWDDNDPEDPQQWATAYKCWVTFQLGMLALAGSLGSSITSPADKVIATYVGVGEEVSVLAVSLYIVGFAAGPIIWAPISEIWGRRISLLPAVFCLGLFSIGTATSTNAASVFITRFFAGFFGSAPVSNVSAALGDLWSLEVRGIAVSFYSVMVVGGPSLGPIIGSAILLRLGWRWTEYVQAIWTFFVFFVTLFCLPEVFSLVLLKRKAQRLRKETGINQYHHPHEDLEIDVRSIVTKQLARPMKMLFTEPIVTCIAFYAAFVYAILYVTLEAFPFVFSRLRGWNSLIGSLPFLGLFIGVCISMAVNVANQFRYTRISRAAGGKAVPEARLPPMALGAVLFVVGLFWFAWTGSPSHHWILPCLAAVFIGFGFNSIFQQSINYLIDVYKIYAASATAAVTFLRSIMAAGLPLAVNPLLSKLGVGPGLSVFGGVAALLLPVPLLFMKFGPRIRGFSKLAPE
ncbi:hypothetical protein ANO11243_002900 [Dothideomycetidae sp. 11243]|nr:hypothetical protein ANO11243_002900 [fungal sp. No.11243]